MLFSFTFTHIHVLLSFPFWYSSHHIVAIHIPTIAYITKVIIIVVVILIWMLLHICLIILILISIWIFILVLIDYVFVSSLFITYSLKLSPFSSSISALSVSFPFTSHHGLHHRNFTCHSYSHDSSYRLIYFSPYLYFNLHPNYLRKFRLAVIFILILSLINIYILVLEFILMFFFILILIVFISILIFIRILTIVSFFYSWDVV